MWCRADITLPEAAANKTVAMELDLGGEATLFVNGKRLAPAGPNGSVYRTIISVTIF